MSESVCLQCENKRICATGVKQPNERIIVGGCSRFEQKKTITNADGIRAMSDEELADFLLHICDWKWMEWLKEEVSG